MSSLVQRRCTVDEAEWRRLPSSLHHASRSGCYTCENSSRCLAPGVGRSSRRPASGWQVMNIRGGNHTIRSNRVAIVVATSESLQKLGRQPSPSPVGAHRKGGCRLRVCGSQVAFGWPNGVNLGITVHLESGPGVLDQTREGDSAIWRPSRRSFWLGRYRLRRPSGLAASALGTLLVAISTPGKSR